MHFFTWSHHEGGYEFEIFFSCTVMVGWNHIRNIQLNSITGQLLMTLWVWFIYELYVDILSAELSDDVPWRVKSTHASPLHSIVIPIINGNILYEQPINRRLFGHSISKMSSVENPIVFRIETSIDIPLSTTFGLFLTVMHRLPVTTCPGKKTFAGLSSTMRISVIPDDFAFNKLD